MTEEVKPDLTGLFRDNPATPEGKYLVKRRDGTVVEWPSFVLGARDPMAPWALRFYAVLGLLMGHFTWGFTRAAWGWASTMRQYRRDHGTGDPGKGRHRKDDPATVEEMRKGMSA